MLPRQGREAPRRVQAILARTPTTRRVTVRAITMGRRDRLAATTLVPLARAAGALQATATVAHRPCLLLTRLRASLTRNETTMTRRPHTMPPLTAELTLRRLARLWPTLSARFLTLRLA